ncbi:SulP family inorganic anion transporter [Putridiphycobacter roseus]|uniref:SulP family inorganic anion transporter n=1 Tax=Putridiphycobacter roseus TaxID=2219161 RepID=A0A2W1NR00_9FLAO|nr:SulP family inorganic anion transporter [Putridiphycobacter roseus]PZE18082.1 SulP family inorganic anion transporter [Putridiphycobacter roseus]
MQSKINNLNPFKNLNKDIPASVVVFLVALPLCLGIALASGAPPLAGIISGIIGGIVVGSLSGSPLGVSGPAAGLAVIVFEAIKGFGGIEGGGFEIFLVAVMLAGIIQIIMGILRAGIIAYYFPSSVIHGMLAGIGILIFLKQIPHAFGYDKDPEGDFEFFQRDNENTFSELANMFNFVSPGVIIITAISLVILIGWQAKIIQKNKILSLIPGPLLAVVAGIVLNILFKGNTDLAIAKEHLVDLPIASSTSDFLSNFKRPNFSALKDPQVYITAIVIAAIASIETLLCVEASDKQDDLKRITPTNKELRAQGIGNLISGFIGGLPITQVIVRSSANQQAGGKTKASTILHGFLLLISIITIPFLLNMIPLATLAAILLVVGFKLAKPALFRKMYRQGLGQFLPFLITVLGILFTDLLMGIGMGLVVAIFIILRNNFKVPFELSGDLVEDGKKKIIITLSEDVTFLNKASVLNTLSKIPDNSIVIIDGSKTQFIHYDVIEIFENFAINAKSRDINLSVKGLDVTKSKSPLQHFKISN